MDRKIIYIASYEEVTAAQEHLAQAHKEDTHKNNKSGSRYDGGVKQPKPKPMSMMELYMANGYTFVERPPEGYCDRETATKIALKSAVKELERYPAGGEIVDWETKEVLYETEREKDTSISEPDIHIVGPNGEVVYKDLPEQQAEFDNVFEHDEYGDGEQPQETQEQGWDNIDLS